MFNLTQIFTVDLNNQDKLFWVKFKIQFQNSIQDCDIVESNSSYYYYYYLYTTFVSHSIVFTLFTPPLLTLWEATLDIFITKFIHKVSASDKELPVGQSQSEQAVHQQQTVLDHRQSSQPSLSSAGENRKLVD